MSDIHGRDEPRLYGNVLPPDEPDGLWRMTLDELYGGGEKLTPDEERMFAKAFAKKCKQATPAIHPEENEPAKHTIDALRLAVEQALPTARERAKLLAEVRDALVRDDKETAIALMRRYCGLPAC